MGPICHSTNLLQSFFSHPYYISLFSPVLLPLPHAPTSVRSWRTASLPRCGDGDDDLRADRSGWQWKRRRRSEQEAAARRRRSGAWPSSGGSRLLAGDMAGRRARRRHAATAKTRCGTRRSEVQAKASGEELTAAWVKLNVGWPCSSSPPP